MLLVVKKFQHANYTSPSDLTPEIKIKICGMTRPLDVRAAVALGVDAIGVILHADSPRNIDISTACQIRAEVPALVNMVGVFVDAEAEFINHCVHTIGLDLVQLHGDETDSFGQALDTCFIKAIRAKSAAQVKRDLAIFPSAAALLLDPYVRGQHGGTGKTLALDLWPSSATTNNAVRSAQQAGTAIQKLILAGGLSPANVAAAAAQTQPFAVDLNSGVESQPGIKDPALIAAVLQALGRPCQRID